MSGTTNFVEHNPTNANQENDATYQADATRSGGIVLNQALPSVWLNKVWTQSSRMATALALMLVNKGYSPVDGTTPQTNNTSFSTATTNLAAVLANILTFADLTLANIVSGLGFTPVRQGGGPTQGTSQINIGVDTGAATRARLAIAGVDEGQLAYVSDVFAGESGNYRIQWGVANSTSVTFPIAFNQHGGGQPVVMALGNFGGSNNIQSTSYTGFTLALGNTTTWIAIGPL